jgi:hypothetical protein|tara:strand:- start:352 stop:585 length:234 start_codon:yes stop_codon:yes gene_type:complete
MRLINKIFIDKINISIFDFDLKYVIKFELRGLEQTYKVDKLEFDSVSELESKLKSINIQSIKNRFTEMSDDLKKMYN